MAPTRLLHPLLLDPSYWRSRLQEQRETRHGLRVFPRPDLSYGACEVEELHLRAHDGRSLRALVGRCPFHRPPRPVRLRRIGPCDVPAPDRGCIEAGSVDLVLQVPAGRRLEDRVLDVLRLFEVIECLQGVDGARITLATHEDAKRPDEFRIASELVAGGLLDAGPGAG